MFNKNGGSSKRTANHFVDVAFKGDFFGKKYKAKTNTAQQTPMVLVRLQADSKYLIERNEENCAGWENDPTGKMSCSSCAELR
jgi:hypothetical protein